MKNQTFQLLDLKFHLKRAFTNTIPTNGPVQEKDTKPESKAHKKDSYITSFVNFCLSDFITQEFGNVISAQE